MSVDEALKYIISMGVVAPPARRNRSVAGKALTHRIQNHQPTESLTSMRTHYCGQLNSQLIGQEPSPFAAGRIVAATTAASSSSTCATAKAWPRSSATRIAPRCSVSPNQSATSSA